MISVSSGNLKGHEMAGERIPICDDCISKIKGFEAKPFTIQNARKCVVCETGTSTNKEYRSVDLTIYSLRAVSKIKD